MTRSAFLAKLHQGLQGLSASAVADIMADYEAHFAEAEAAGRSEADVVRALGDPTRLARELRADLSLKRWEAERNPSAATGAVIAVLGLCAIDILILLPILFPAALVLLAFYIASIAGFVGGAFAMIAGPFGDPPGGPATAIFLGLGVMSLSVAAGALLTLITIGSVNALVWYGRLHFRLLNPETQKA